MTLPDAPPPPMIMAPGTYLQKRREAAGFKIEDVATMLAPTAADRKTLRNDIALPELGLFEPARVARGEAADLVDSLLAAFSFDQYVYFALVGAAADPAAAADLPAICRVCACTQNDACDHPDHGPCAWSGEEPNLCTSCEWTEQAATAWREAADAVTREVTHAA